MTNGISSGIKQMGRVISTKSQRELSGEKEMFYALVIMVVPWCVQFVQTH